MEQEAKVLLLNQSFEPLCFCGIKRAMKMLALEKLEIVDVIPDSFIRLCHSKIPMPSTVRLKSGHHRPRYVRVKLNKRNVLKRDKYTCSYCGSKTNLTVDHVIPKSRGGGTNWENLVAACRKCNNKKDNKLPSEIGMVLSTKPMKPNRIIFLSNMGGSIREEWKQFLYIN